MSRYLAVVLLIGLPGGAAGQWRISTFSDSLTDAVIVHVESPSAGAYEALGSSDESPEAWIGFGCTATTEWAFVGFNRGFHVAGGSARSGARTIDVGIGWDDRAEDVAMIQEADRPYLHFVSDEPAIASLRAATAMLIDVRRDEAGVVRFRLPLAGSREAIDSARSRCRSEARPPGVVTREGSRAAQTPPSAVRNA